MSPPCSTFGCRRADGGPAPLRGATVETIYGLKGLTVDEQTRVKLGTLLANRSAEAASIAKSLNIPWVLEQPADQPGRPHMTLLASWAKVVEDEQAHRNYLDQCNFGCEFLKPTLLLGTISFRNSPGKCQHPKRWFREIPSGNWKFAAHPPLSGKIKAVPAELWHDGLYSVRASADMPYLTRATAAYPSLMNRYLARSLVMSALDFRISCIKKSSLQLRESDLRKRCLSLFGGAETSTSTLSSSDWGVGRSDIFFSQHLKGVPQMKRRKVGEDEDALGGLRHPARAVERCPSLSKAGRVVRNCLERFLKERPEVLKGCVEMIGSESDEEFPPPEVLNEVRSAMFNALGAPCEIVDPNPDVPTPVQYKLLEAWRKAAGDPDSAVAGWFEHGAPAGLSMPVEQCGVFPTSETHDPPEMAATDPDTFVNYEGVDQDQSAWDEIMALHSKGMIAKFDSYDDLVKELGARPVISRVGIVEKISSGKLKRRVIVDSAQSGVSGNTSKPERVVLPRLLDVINNVLFQLAHNSDAKRSTELLVLDFSNAFFIIPLHPSERRHFVIRLRGKWFLFKVQAQGAAASPLVWGRVAALVSRLTQGMFDPIELLLQVFVDDPCMSLTGTTYHRNLCTAIVVLAWRALGFPLAFRKGQRGPAVVWIGGTVRVHRSGVEASIKKSILDDLGSQVDELLKSNTCSKKALRSFAGRANHVATLLWPWRPFLQHLWAALCTEPQGAPPNCVWFKQISNSVEWIKAFLDGAAGSVRRDFSIDAYLNEGLQIELTLDASPWGLGGILKEDGEIIEFFASPLTHEDFGRFKFQAGSPDGQQCWESLSALVALRLWKSRWLGQRVRIQVRGDSVAMLTLVMKMKPPSNSQSLGLISRELALDIVESVYSPDVVSHLPGISNVGADVLSRKLAPSETSWKLPAWLANVPEARAPVRNLSFYRTLRYV